MGKQSRKNKKSGSNSNSNSKPADNDTAVFISKAQEHKHEGNKLFQTKDYEGAILKYEKALGLLPGNHIDVSYVRSNIAACYMQMGITDFPRAIHECNLALEVTPRYSKALLKRARCYEALNRLDLALRDGNRVLDIEPGNLMAMEIVDRVKSRIESKPIEDFPNDKMEPEKVKVIKNVKKIEENGPEKAELIENVKKIEENGPGKAEVIENVKKLEENGPEKAEIENVKKIEENGPEKTEVIENVKRIEEYGPEKAEIIENVKKIEDKLVVEEKVRTEDEDPKQVVKLVYGDDIRWAKIPVNCGILTLREAVRDRFPVSKAVLIKYRDEEGDMVTITTDEELRWAESPDSGHRTAVRLHVIEVNPEHDPFFDHLRRQERTRKLANLNSGCIDDWIPKFAHLFKKFVGFDSDGCLDLHELGMKLYSEAMEDTVTSEEAQELFGKAADKFREMTALALFNWGNVHMSRARKGAVKDSYERAKSELSKAGEKYEESIGFKPDFYEGFLALGQQRFEKAKLSWDYAIGKKADLEKWDSGETVRLFNEAEENIEKGMQMWEQIERDLGRIEEEEGANMRSRMNVLWGTMLYERSIMEYKVGIPVWHECLEVAIEKFEAAGASPADIAVMIKNHCSNHNSPEGLGFNIEEIVQAWNEMYEAKMWQTGIPSFQLEPLLRRRVSKLFHAQENA